MTPQDDQTRIAEDETRLSTSDPSGGKPASHVSSSSGWLSTSEAIDHGRFPPGTLLGGRYRIVGRLGRGGMGEVYRADDLKLAQPVALKFLPAELDRDPSRLMQLHNEVRMARQVSHPNVCRVYDIDEVDGHTFLSMEYVDGEELASLLRRIGRFSVERSLELAREICAGLAAAHERGVIHRDLKPANVMIDGTGRVRITDFGLAGVAGESLRAGTPAYMAPEQLAGGEVTAQSDIYALGLVLYELFTGQRAIEAKNVAELLRKREQLASSRRLRSCATSIRRSIGRSCAVSSTIPRGPARVGAGGRRRRCRAAIRWRRRSRPGKRRRRRWWPRRARPALWRRGWRSSGSWSRCCSSRPTRRCRSRRSSRAGCRCEKSPDVLDGSRA